MLNIFTKWTEDYPSPFRMWMGNKLFIFINKPDQIKVVKYFIFIHILQYNIHIYLCQTLLYKKCNNFEITTIIYIFHVINIIFQRYVNYSNVMQTNI